MSGAHAALGVMIGLVSGVLSGLFGVGGGIVMTPGVQILLGARPIVALATPLPVILPTALTGAETYRRAGEVDTHAALWMVGPGIAGAVLGSWLTRLIDTHLLLVVTAVLLAYQAAGILRGARPERPPSLVRARPLHSRGSDCSPASSAGCWGSAAVSSWCRCWRACWGCR